MVFPVIQTSSECKRAAAEEASPLPPLSLANLLEEGNPRPCFRRTQIKPHKLKSIDSSPCHASASSMLLVCATVITQFLSCCACWSEKNNALIKLWSNVSGFLTADTCFPVPRVRDDVVQVSCQNLPLELWGEIGKRLKGRLDILRFRSVCKKWRSCLPPPTCFPLWVPGAPSNIPSPNTLLPPGTSPFIVEYVRKVRCVITEVSLYTCKGEKGVLVVEELEHGKFWANWLRTSEKGIVKTVKFEYPMISFTTSRWSSRLSFVAKAYHLRVAFFRFNSRHEIVEGKCNLHYNKGVRKMVIISSNGDDGVNPNYVGASNLSAVALISMGPIGMSPMKGRLALLRLDGSPDNWIWKTDFCTQVFEDIATYRGKLCALDASGRVLLMEYTSLRMTQLSPPCPFIAQLKNKNLFEHHGNLYVANPFGKKEKTFQYKLSLPLQKWIEDDDRLPLSALIPFLVRDGVSWG